jgi:putative acetyltransferase
VSLVAEENRNVVGHIMFSPVILSENPDLKVMGLAPMAVAPEHQRKGIGSALVRAGLEQCRQLGFVGVVVLGHPEFYPRFGFSPSSRFGIDSDYEVPEEVFMAMELEPEALSGKTGRVKYHHAFSNV